MLAGLAAATHAVSAPSAGSRRPLIAGAHSHIVVMEYEAWFGPDAVTFQNAEALPLLRSADMDKVGGGYDSHDPAIIAQHVAWLEQLGADAITLDLTNNISCIFDSEWFVRKYLRDFNGCPAYRRGYRQIRDNAGNLYPAWTRIGTRLKIIPLLGAIDANAFIADRDGKTAFEKEIAYFATLMQADPALSVIYQGKPLLLIYLGAPVNPGTWPTQLTKVRRFLADHSGIAAHFTIRMMSGYLESQPQFWLNATAPAGPIEINPIYGFWSVVDRLKPHYGYYPTFNRAGLVVENMTASIATPGQNGWGCPEPLACPDDGLRYGTGRSYATLGAFMAYAATLRPIFLFFDQFNEFDRGDGDEGWNADTSDDIEPSHLWHGSALAALRGQIARYRAQLAGTAVPDRVNRPPGG
jgi:hypothetical protein